MVEQPVFERGDTVSKCVDRDIDYPNLCYADEVFDISTPVKTSPTKVKNGKGGNNGRKAGKTVKTGGGGYHHTYHHRYHF
jgi:hypothetical protein